VAHEQNITHYDLERSIDGINFMLAGKISATGNSEYSYSDNVSGITASLYYYRLKSTDADGNFKYSAIVKIRLL
jgi:hypothetical protein